MSAEVAAKPQVEVISEAEIAELAVTRARIEDSNATKVLPRVWGALWPKLLAVGLVVLIWQLAVLAAWKPTYILPGPGTVLERLWSEMTGSSASQATLWDQISLTMRRGLLGYALAIVIGTTLGIGVVQWRTLRMAIGSLIAGIQTMPSIAWFPLAILFFGLNESAILFVVILGAAPSIAAGVITGIDEVPPPLLRAGKMLGATGINRYRHIVLPAAMPSYVAGLKQGWAFAWRSLLAGELLVPIGGAASLGSALMYSRTVPNGAPWLLALMIVILIIGMAMDAIFGIFTRRIRQKRGLTGLV
ncbi:MAG: sulfonate transport system permease protein [Actinomycetota bacterium]|jgi:NitT/TauT family transport system permease protein|nr:sulfonate transport system permease protein [Actinomycetota bacterium]